MDSNDPDNQDHDIYGKVGDKIAEASTHVPGLNDETFQLSEFIFMFPHKRIGEHGNVYEGEVRSSVYGVRSCVIKFAALSQQNVREAEILTKLGSHTNVIAMIQSGRYCEVFDDRIYIALDKCHNENLRQYLANRKAAGIEFDLNQAIDFAKQIIAGVTYIHDNNVIHLDLKPSNILISQNIRLIKIADFGLSIVVKSPKSKLLHKNQFGTNGYRPLESFGNGVVSQRTDIFSVGAVLLHLLSNGNDVFGRDEHAFFHKVINDITDTSGLLVPNPNTTQHLITCMVSKERCSRPNIWEVCDHPCWTGKETDCQFGYHADDEIDETDDGIINTEEHQIPSSNIELGSQFLQRMRKMGFNRKPSIIVFDYNSRYLCHFDHRSNSIKKIHKYPDDISMVHRNFLAVSFGEYIYIFLKFRSVYRLEYGDVSANWDRMNDRIGDHLRGASLTKSSEAIFILGGRGSESHLISKYNPLLDEWTRMNDKPTAIRNSAVLCFSGFLYCFGGSAEMGTTNAAERMNITTMEWRHLANMNQPRRDPSACQFEGKFYVLGGYMRRSQYLNSVEVYNPQLDQWTEMKPMLEARFYFESFWIDGHLFAVCGFRRNTSIEKYDPIKNEWKIAARFPDVRIYRSVLVSMSA